MNRYTSLTTFRTNTSFGELTISNTVKIAFFVHRFDRKPKSANSPELEE